jgi:hypothetical protein
VVGLALANGSAHAASLANGALTDPGHEIFQSFHGADPRRFAGALPVGTAAHLQPNMKARVPTSESGLARRLTTATDNPRLQPAQ